METVHLSNLESVAMGVVFLRSQIPAVCYVSQCYFEQALISGEHILVSEARK